MCMCISFRPAVGHVEASGAHNGIAEQQKPQECEEQEAIVLVNLPTDNSCPSLTKDISSSTYSLEVSEGAQHPAVATGARKSC